MTLREVDGNIGVTVEGRNARPAGQTPDEVSFDVSIEGVAEWISVPYPCSDLGREDAPGALYCRTPPEWQGAGAREFRYELVAAPESAGEYLVAARYGSAEPSAASTASLSVDRGTTAYPGAASTSVDVSGPPNGPDIPEAVTVTVGGTRGQDLVGGEWFEVRLGGRGGWDPATIPDACAASPHGEDTLRCVPDWSDGEGGEQRFDGFALSASVPHDDVLRVDARTCLQRGAETGSCFDGRTYRATGSGVGGYVFFTPAPVNHYLASDDRAAVSPDRSVLSVAVRTDARTSRRGQSAEELDVAIELPENVRVLDAEVRWAPFGGCYRPGCTPPVSAECDQGRGLTCHIRHVVRNGYSPPAIHLSLSTDDPTLDADAVFTLSGDEDPSDDVHRVRLVGYGSAQALQNVIDATPAGGTVELPAGRWLGELDGRGRSIVVRGARDGARTVLRAHSGRAIIANVGVDSHWSDIDYEITGGSLAVGFGDGLRISDGRIEGAAGWRRDPLLGADTAAGFALENNVITSFGAPEACEALLRVSRSAPARRVRLTGNLFADNRCDHLLSYGAIGADERSALIVAGNTIVGHASVLRLIGHPDAVWDVAFEDNVVVGAEAVVSIQGGTDLPRGAGLRTASNLVHGGAATAAVGEADRARPGVSVAAPDLVADPLFTDPGAGDFRLGVLSPAIDAGSSALARGGDAVVDGDGDGAAAPDIGAFEFAP